jgi:hypothetical protein
MNQDASTYRTHLPIGQMADGPSWQGHLQSFSRGNLLMHSMCINCRLKIC